MDAGWLKTADTLFENAVEKIYPSVLSQLNLNSNYTFTVGDIYFFRRYYLEADGVIKNQIKKLVKNGQLEFVHGGMVSTDEATTDYADIIRNFE